MRPFHFTIILLVLLSTLALAGCGTGSGASTSAGSKGKIAKVSFRSAAIKSTATGSSSIPSQYTCDGKNTPPPLEWGAVPARTGELVLFVLGLKPLAGTNEVNVSVEWAMAGINPALHHLDPGQLPQGAHPGFTSGRKRSYSICPKHGQSAQYDFELYGLPVGDAVPLTFNGPGILSKLVASSRESLANAQGSFEVVYKRP